MTETVRYTFGKEEKIYHKRDIDRLFKEGGSHSMTAFPLRAVFTFVNEEANADALPPVRMMVSVPKRCFKHAVKRNRVKRQVREAYRLHKHGLSEVVRAQGKLMLVAFIWMDANLHESRIVDKRVNNLLTRIKEKVQ